MHCVVGELLEIVMLEFCCKLFLQAFCLILSTLVNIRHNNGRNETSSLLRLTVCAQYQQIFQHQKQKCPCQTMFKWCASKIESCYHHRSQYTLHPNIWDICDIGYQRNTIMILQKIGKHHRMKIFGKTVQVDRAASKKKHAHCSVHATA